MDGWGHVGCSPVALTDQRVLLGAERHDRPRLQAPHLQARRGDGRKEGDGG